MADDPHKLALRIHNDPKLSHDQKVNKLRDLFGPLGKASWEELVSRQRATRSVDFPPEKLPWQ